MPSFRHLVILLITTFGFCGILDYAQPKLSDYGFFEEPLKNQVPKSHVIPYQISTPLFTDYAKKNKIHRSAERRKNDLCGF